MNPALKEIVDKLELADLKALNAYVVACINEKEARPADDFKVGDLITFTAKGRKVRARVKSLNRVRMSCVDIDTGAGWRVPYTMAEHLSKEDAETPAPAPAAPSIPEPPPMVKVIAPMAPDDEEPPETADDSELESLFKPGGTKLPKAPEPKPNPAAAMPSPDAEGAGAW